MTESIMLKKSKAFALRIVRLYKHLREHKESVIAKQMLRSGSSIGNRVKTRPKQSKCPGRPTNPTVPPCAIYDAGRGKEPSFNLA